MSKQLYTLEYAVRCSPSILFEFLSTPAGLQEWFADKVDERDQVFSFSWSGSTDRAQVLESELDKSIRFHWLHAPKNEYFEFRIEKAEVTIYDRWGQSVFHSIGYGTPWNGTNRGKYLPTGPYYFVIQLNSPVVYIEPIVGNIAIVR